MNRSENTFTRSDHYWLLFFALASSMILIVLYANQTPHILMKALVKMNKAAAKEKRNSQIFNVTLENPKEKSEKEKKELKYLSNKDSKAKGRTRKKKKFESFDNPNEKKLQWAKRGSLASGKKVIKLKSYEELSNLKAMPDFYVQIVRPQKTHESGLGGYTPTGKQKKTSIPDAYTFRRSFALSWNRSGEPRIPTVYWKHYEYFKTMSRKVGESFSPPGGNPFPVFGDEYHSVNPIPGRTRYQVYPSQMINVVFSIDETGEVLEARLWSSLGYKALDEACVDAILRVKNFGPPPKEILKEGILVVPFTFIIY